MTTHAHWDGTTPYTDTYEILRHLFHMAREESIRAHGSPYWRLSATDSRDPSREMMTEYEAIDGSHIRCRSYGERDATGRFKCHTFTYFSPMDDR